MPCSNYMFVKPYLIILILLLSTTFSFAQALVRLKEETPEQFVARFKPEHSEITHQVIQTSWNASPSIIAFYDQTYKLAPDQQEYHRIIAVIFMKEKDHYRKLLIDTIYSEGGDPKIESVFFSNADKDLKKELIIISSWEQRHLDVNGTLYQTFIYDDLSTHQQSKLHLLKDISGKLSGDCECDWSDGTRKRTKLKTAAGVKEELKRIGY
jgi:hypothetical protein